MTRMSDLLAALPNPRVSLQTHRRPQLQGPPSTGGPFFHTEFFWIGGNPQHQSWTATLDRALDEAPAESTLLCWSGTFADELFAGDMRNWTRLGKPTLEVWLESTLARIAAHGSGHTLGLVPHHTHLLSDVSGQMRLFHARGERRFTTILYPSALLAPSMMRDAHDHLTRAISMVAPRCDLCILEDLAPSTTAASDEGAFDRVAWQSGILSHEFVHGLLAEHLPPTTPIVLSTPPFFC